MARDRARECASGGYSIPVLMGRLRRGKESLHIPAFGGGGRRLARLATLAIVGLVLAACTEQTNHNPTGDDLAPNLFGQTSNGVGFPHEVVTSQGIQASSLYLPVFIIAVVIFILVEGLLLYLSLRFRRRSTGNDLPEQVHGNNRLEMLWTAIPMAIVLVLFVVSTVVLNDVQSVSAKHGAVVDVEAFRFGWTFKYDDPTSGNPETGEYQPLAMAPISGGGRAGAPQMVLPVGEPVLIRLNSADVIHSFYVPSFFFKRDVIPGRTNEFELTIEKPGVYGGQCAEFCGTAHSDMYFSVNAVEPAEYDAWIAQQTAGASPAPVPSAEPAASAAPAASAEPVASAAPAASAEPVASAEPAASGSAAPEPAASASAGASPAASDAATDQTGDDTSEEAA
jgi:cytochrome c oxidase subunit 2